MTKLKRRDRVLVGGNAPAGGVTLHSWAQRRGWVDPQRTGLYV
jgi:hypothetical protein